MPSLLVHIHSERGFVGDSEPSTYPIVISLRTFTSSPCVTSTSNVQTPATTALVVCDHVSVWSLDVEVTQGDNVDVVNDIIIGYVEGSESPTNPRSE